MKHQSAWDTLILPVVLGDPAVVIKRELLWVPFYGWYAARAGSIAIDRRGGAGGPAPHARGGARGAAMTAAPIVIFPEGTRTAPGQRLTYQPGVAALYQALGAAAGTGGGQFRAVLGPPQLCEAAGPDRLVVPRSDPARPAAPRGRCAELESRIETATAALEAEGLAAYRRRREPVFVAAADDLIERIRALRRHALHQPRHVIRCAIAATRRYRRRSSFANAAVTSVELTRHRQSRTPMASRSASPNIQLQQMLDDVLAERLDVCSSLAQIFDLLGDESNRDG